MLPKNTSLCLQFVRTCHVKLHIVFMWFISLLLLFFISFTFWFLVYLKNVSFLKCLILLYIVRFGQNAFWTFNGNAMSWMHYDILLLRCFAVSSTFAYMFKCFIIISPWCDQAFTQRHSCVFLHLKIVISSLFMFILPLYAFYTVLSISNGAGAPS